MIDENNQELEFDNEEFEEIQESSTKELSKIVSYNIANTIEVLKFKIDNGEIDLKPEFQRDFVWDINRASLFIDSLLIGLPIPSVFLGKSSEDETYKVIDGQQRLKSAYFYLQGKFNTKGKEQIFNLRKLEDRDWNGKTFAELDQKYQRRIRNAVLNTTIIEDIDTNPRVVHDIFHRLNTGGMPLKDQEIRNCIYTGLFNTNLFILNENEEWRNLLGQPYPDRRLRDIELVLRFFALHDNLENYKPSMREFLSNYQKTNSNKLPDKEIWDKTISLVSTKIGNDAFKIKRSVNKSVCDSVLVSIAQILADGKAPIDLAVNHKRLLADQDYIKYVSSGTSSETSVNGRIALARNYFLGLK
ncbi:DUF262 domain-containing protein [Algibacter luteus]|uniref:GmrSD restriction endonucleases N-terminal domain-containing protein n=1 Tax=Algibacter luteus TaxID=1178825 RepID=A0A1M5ZZP8_9FLAO|nr:DUF262 domain-containing protein [Algibacter luteus]SHI29383.1 Protein of unknown function DUF262 [Algibacter luteus]